MIVYIVIYDTSENLVSLVGLDVTRGPLVEVNLFIRKMAIKGVKMTSRAPASQANLLVLIRECSSVARIRIKTND